MILKVKKNLFLIKKKKILAGDSAPTFILNLID